MYLVSAIRSKHVNEFLFFFFQAEDGIRYWSVTGVQTCALPIYIAEAAFKAVARALRDALEVDPRRADAIPSTKGAL